MTDVCRVGDNVLDKKTVPIVFVPGVISQKESALWSLHSIPFRTTSNSPYNV